MNEPLFYPYYGLLGREPEFEIGYPVMTRGLRDVLDKDKSFIVEIDNCFERFIHKDWGYLSLNSKGKPYAIRKGEEIMGGYETSKGDICITTSHDRLYTILMLNEER